jgi:hypothetical protein
MGIVAFFDPFGYNMNLFFGIILPLHCIVIMPIIIIIFLVGQWNFNLLTFINVTSLLARICS